MKFCTIQHRCRYLLCFRLDAIISTFWYSSVIFPSNKQKFLLKIIKNKQWTYCSSFMSQTWFYFLVPFFCFSIRKFNSSCSFYYYCNWPENSPHHAYSRHHANKEWLIFPATTLIPGTTLIKNGSSFPPPRFFRATRLFGREE